MQIVVLCCLCLVRHPSSDVPCGVSNWKPKHEMGLVPAPESLGFWPMLGALLRCMLNCIVVRAISYANPFYFL